MPMKRVVRSGLLLGALVSVLPPAANAGVLDDIRGSIASLWRQKANKQSAAHTARIQANQKNQQVRLLHERLEDTQKLLEVATQRYENYFGQMRRTEAKILETRDQIRETTARYNRHKARFSARLAAMQQQGSPNFLPIALSAKSLSDLSRRVNLFQTLTQHDAALQRELQADRLELSQAHNSLMSQWSERDQLQKQANRERERIIAGQKRQQTMWKQLNASRQALLQYAMAQEQSSREIEGMINSLESRKSQIIAAYEAQEARERLARLQQARSEAAARRSRRSRTARTTRRRSGAVGSGADKSANRYAPQVDVGRRYAPQVDVGPRYAPRVELSSYQVGGAYNSGSDWTMPARGRLSSRFGMRFHPVTHRYKLHTGDDIAAPQGAPIRAARTGRVLWAGWKKAYGNTIIMDVGGGKTVLYGHASRLSVRAGQPVKAGQYIGNVGSTGWSTGPHLHFEVRQNGRPINPTGFLHRH